MQTFSILAGICSCRLVFSLLVAHTKDSFSRRGPIIIVLNKVFSCDDTIRNVRKMYNTECKNTLQQYNYNKQISKEEGNDQGSIQSNTIPDPGHHLGK